MARPVVAGALCAMLAAGLGLPDVQKELSSGAARSSLEAQETQAAASLLGQFRTSLDAWLWVRTDVYLHNGVEMRPLTTAELKRGLSIDQAAPQERDLGKESVVTVIPDAARDFRGPIGDIERATSAYQGMKGHTHNDPSAVLPLFRLMTLADPSFVPAWVEGGSVLARDRSEQGTERAIAYLKEGLDKNPTSIEILTELGGLYITRQRDYHLALRTLDQARVQGDKLGGKLTEDQKDALQTCYRYIALSLRNLDRTADMRVFAAEGLRLFPDDAVLTKMAR